MLFKGREAEYTVVRGLAQLKRSRTMSETRSAILTRLTTAKDFKREQSAVVMKLNEAWHGEASHAYYIFPSAMLEIDARQHPTNARYEGLIQRLRLMKQHVLNRTSSPHY